MPRPVIKNGICLFVILCVVSAELLKKKDQEMKDMEDRYETYLEKAKSVSIIDGERLLSGFLFAKQRDARAMALAFVRVDSCGSR